LNIHALVFLIDHQHTTQWVVVLRLGRVFELTTNLGNNHGEDEQSGDTKQHGEDTDEDDDLADGSALIPVAGTEIRAADKCRQVATSTGASGVDANAGETAGSILQGSSSLGVVHRRGRLAG